MRIFRGAFYLMFFTLAFGLVSSAKKKSKSMSLKKTTSISKMIFLKAISSDIIGFRGNISKIWKDIGQLRKTFNDNNYCDLQKGSRKTSGRGMKSRENNMCSLIRTLNTDVTQLEKTFNANIRTLEQNQADVKAKLDNTSSKVEKHGKDLNSFDKFNKGSLKKHDDELNTLNISFVKNTEDIQTIKNILSTLKECPSGWSKYGLSCYSFGTESLTWKNAVKACKKEKAQLVEYESEDEVKFVLDLVLSIAGRYGSGKFTGFLIGGSDQKKEGTWKWTSSGRAIDAGFTYWLEGQPDNYSNEDCLTSCINQNGTWNDIDCNNERKYVCEKPLFDNID